MKTHFIKQVIPTLVLGIILGFAATSLLFWERGQSFSFLTWGINSDSSKGTEDCLRYLKSYVQSETSAHGHQRTIICLKRPARVIKLEE